MMCNSLLSTPQSPLSHSLTHSHRRRLRRKPDPLTADTPLTCWAVETKNKNTGNVVVPTHAQR